jgi:hypothetical protein
MQENTIYSRSQCCGTGAGTEGLIDREMIEVEIIYYGIKLGRDQT